MTTDSAPRTKSRKIPRRIVRRTSSFILVCLFLLFVNCMTTPGHWWVVWVIAGWGLSLAVSLVHHWIGWDDDETPRR